VWKVLLTIPFGRTKTYGEVAAQVGSGAVPRATGSAVGRNPVSILVPCHRVIGANGSLTGYAGGLPRKERLLQHEGVLLT
jgi:methylated-DNA-[protein]-cysteine S-methyltransferase